ncbi:MAG: restriction endonuclease subunit S [Pseudomonadales bacterium]|nr:restriction endonuclease subunit S [Pseudomonadales bacterium]
MAAKKARSLPEIRFSGFERDWELEPLLKRIDDIVDFRGRTPKKLGLEWSESGYLALSALNVKDGFIDATSDAHFGDDELYNAWMRGNELHQNQVLFTTEAPMGNVAQVPDTQKYILSQRTIAFVTDPNILSDDYLAVLLKSPGVVQQLLARASGGTAKGVSQKSLASLRITIGDALAEQEKIGSYFKSLDRMIGLHQRKHDKLVTLKQAMLQKMFPQDGATTPEIRFKGFEGEWEECDLAEFSDIKTGPFGSMLHAEDYVTNGTPIITTEHFKYWRLPTIKKGLPQVSADDRNRLNSYELSTGDIVFSRVGSIDINARVEEAQDGWLFSGRVLRVRVTEAIDTEYLHHVLSTYRVRKNIADRAVGQTMPSINTVILGRTPVQLPKELDEQEKIGQYFRKLNDLIAEHSAQIEKLKNIKSACLEKMFV